MKVLTAKVSPVLAVALAGLWLLLNQSLSVTHLMLGAALGIAIAGFAAALRPLHARLRRVDRALLLILVVLKDIVVSNYSVAKIVLRTSRG